MERLICEGDSYGVEMMRARALPDAIRTASEQPMIINPMPFKGMPILHYQDISRRISVPVAGPIYGVEKALHIMIEQAAPYLMALTVTLALPWKHGR